MLLVIYLFGHRIELCGFVPLPTLAFCVLGKKRHKDDGPNTTRPSAKTSAKPG